MSDISSRFGDLVAKRGFAQIPNYLLLFNKFVDDERRLSPLQLLILIQLVSAWWKKDTMPYPGMAALAVNCGVSERQIQRSINQLVKTGLIGRQKRSSTRGVRATNAYDLQPLVTMLEEIATAFPNEYPRNLDRAKVQAISERLDSMAQGKAPAV